MVRARCSWGVRRGSKWPVVCVDCGIDERGFPEFAGVAGVRWCVGRGISCKIAEEGVGRGSC